MGQGSSLLAEEQQSLLAFTSETPVAFDSELWLSLFRFKVRRGPRCHRQGSAGRAEAGGLCACIARRCTVFFMTWAACCDFPTVSSSISLARAQVPLDLVPPKSLATDFKDVCERLGAFS